MTESDILKEINRLPNGIRSLYFTPKEVAAEIGTNTAMIRNDFNCFRFCCCQLIDYSGPKLFTTRHVLKIGKDICYLSRNKESVSTSLAVSWLIKEDLKRIHDLIKKGGQYYFEFQSCHEKYWHPEKFNQCEVDFVSYIRNNFGQYLDEVPNDNSELPDGMTCNLL